MIRSILVTGGLGYVGGRVAAALEQKGLKVSVGTRQNNIGPLKWLPNTKLIEMDLMDESSLDKACKGQEAIVHLAAMNEIDCAEYPEMALTVNGLGTLKLLRAAQRNAVKRFLYFSTAHVYGAPLAGFIDEKTVPRPIHPYAITHHVAEDFVLSAHEKGDLLGVVFRLSNGFGAPKHADVNRWTLVVNDLCRQAVTTKKLVLKSSGLQRRDFITLTDIARAVIHFLVIPKEKLQDGLYNLGGECSLSIIEITNRIAERCEKILGFKPAIERPIPNELDTSMDLEYSVGKLKNTGFLLKGDVDQEIDNTLLLCQGAFGEGL